jgi:hypothetical protein
MNLQFYFEKLLNSEEFRKFKDESPDAYLCSGFFVIDKTGKEGDKQHLDYYIPSTKKLFSFQLESKIEVVPIEQVQEKVLEKINDNVNFEFEEIEKIIDEEMVKQNVKDKIQKILLSLQKIDGKDLLIGTVFISTLGMIKVSIDLVEKNITEFEKKSFFDMLKIVKGKKK